MPSPITSDLTSEIVKSLVDAQAPLIPPVTGGDYNFENNDTYQFENNDTYEFE